MRANAISAVRKGPPAGVKDLLGGMEKIRRNWYQNCRTLLKVETAI